MKTIIILAFIGVVVLSGCHILMPLEEKKEATTEFFKGEYRGPIDLGAWGDYMEVELRQAKDGTKHGWIVHGTGRSYLKEKPNFRIEFMIDGHVSADNLQEANLNLYRYKDMSKKEKVTPPYTIEKATSDLKKLHLQIKDSSGSIQVDAELPVYEKVLIGGA